MGKKRSAVAVIVGTRPEAIKLAPVIRALSRSRSLRPVTVFTGQHREMVGQMLRRFGLKISFNLEVMRARQTLWGLAARLTVELGRFLQLHPVKAVLVQGDTSSALFGGLCAFYHRLPVGHVEAGLRTGDRYAPFPEEMNRTLLGSLATWHFAPTPEAVRQLRREGISPGSIYLTGNTVVDAVHWTAPRSGGGVLRRVLGSRLGRRRLLLVTCHRRENFGAPLRGITRGLAAIARGDPELVMLCPVHPNPAVGQVIRSELGRLCNVRLCEPLDYAEFLVCLQRSYLVITDSGGVQEEATVLGKPVLVLRHKTERPEGVRAGSLMLVGTAAEAIAKAARRLLEDQALYRRMCKGSTVFGDGRSAERIVTILERSLRSGICWRRLPHAEGSGRAGSSRAEP